MNLTKNDLVFQLTQEGFTKRAATEIIDEFTALIIENLERGNTISIRGFGCFDIQERKARACPNPRTGERMDIPAHWMPRFYPGNEMKRAVKVWASNEKRGLA